MLMLMLNLIKLQHALGASIPNCVIYSKYIFIEVHIHDSHKSHNVRSMVTFFLQFYKQVVSQDL